MSNNLQHPFIPSTGIGQEFLSGRCGLVTRLRSTRHQSVIRFLPIAEHSLHLSGSIPDIKYQDSGPEARNRKTETANVLCCPLASYHLPTITGLPQTCFLVLLRFDQQQSGFCKWRTAALVSRASPHTSAAPIAFSIGNADTESDRCCGRKWAGSRLLQPHPSIPSLRMRTTLTMNKLCFASV